MPQICVRCRTDTHRSRVIFPATMDRLEQLQREYEEITRNLALPFDLNDYLQLRTRRKEIIEEARKLVGSLGIPEPHWFAKH